MPQDHVTRQILTEIERDPSISQKRLAESVGISVGMINWHIKRCVGKGLIKLQQAPVRRYLYYLTPAGFTEKARLTADYLRASFDIFRIGRQQYGMVFETCRGNGWASVALLGDSELADLAIMVLSQVDGVDPVCVLDPRSISGRRGGVPVVTDGAAAITCGKGGIAVLVGAHFDLQVPGAFDVDGLRQELSLPPDRFLTPAFLR